MKYDMLAGKIHRATVTDANLEYEGSISIDHDLMDAARIPPFAKVHIWNITNGERFETYTIIGKRGSGEMVINDAAAHRASTAPPPASGGFNRPAAPSKQPAAM